MKRISSDQSERPYIKYQFSTYEFLELLGITNSGNPLTVFVNFYDSTVEVTMNKREGA